MASGSVRSDCALDSKLMDFSVFQTEEFFFLFSGSASPHTHPVSKFLGRLVPGLGYHRKERMGREKQIRIAQREKGKMFAS